MNLLASRIESLLFVSGTSLSISRLAKLLNTKDEDVLAAIEELQKHLQDENRGVQVARIDDNVQMTTHPDHTEIIEKFYKKEISGDLSQPSLETLTIIAYRGPITKTELELIRGVNCSVIIRNLLIRGLIEEIYDTTTLQNKYSITFEFLKYLGLGNVDNLPNYKHLHSHEILDKLLEGQNQVQE